MKTHKAVLSAALALACFTGCAQAQTAQAVQCSLNYAKAEACQMTDKVGSDGSHLLEFTSAKGRTRFTGKSQTGWWAGELDGQPAMGFERNRGHGVFSTRDLQTNFEYWSAGNEHGSY